jgi:hypothetical protein
MWATSNLSAWDRTGERRSEQKPVAKKSPATGGAKGRVTQSAASPMTAHSGRNGAPLGFNSTVAKLH